MDDIPTDLSEKTVLITGETYGIGLEAARVFASRKCNLIVACRNGEKMAAVAAIFKDNISADNMAMNSYAFSKLAHLLFVEELNRLLIEKGSSVIAVGARPGVSKTDIIAKIEGGGVMKRIFEFLNNRFGQPTADGAWSLLMTATDPNITRDSYYAPSQNGWIVREISGPPIRNGLKGKAVMEKEEAKLCW